MEAKEKTLYRMTPRAGHRWLVAVVAAGASAAFLVAPQDPWLAGFYGLVSVVMVAWRIWRGPPRPDLRWHGSTLEIREYYPPHVLHAIAAEELLRVVVAGPVNDRRFFFHFRNETVREIRPFYPARLARRAEMFLREVLPPAVALELKPKPSFMEQVRGSYP
jgi:hypothetical protein